MRTHLKSNHNILPLSLRVISNYFAFIHRSRAAIPSHVHVHVGSAASSGEISGKSAASHEIIRDCGVGRAWFVPLVYSIYHQSRGRSPLSLAHDSPHQLTILKTTKPISFRENSAARFQYKPLRSIVERHADVKGRSFVSAGNPGSYVRTDYRIFRYIFVGTIRKSAFTQRFLDLDRILCRMMMRMYFI